MHIFHRCSYTRRQPFTVKSSKNDSLITCFSFFFIRNVWHLWTQTPLGWNCWTAIHLLASERELFQIIRKVHSCASSVYVRVCSLGKLRLVQTIAKLREILCVSYCLVRKREPRNAQQFSPPDNLQSQVPLLKSLVWPDWDSNPTFWHLWHHQSPGRVSIETGQRNYKIYPGGDTTRFLGMWLVNSSSESTVACIDTVEALLAGKQTCSTYLILTGLSMRHIYLSHSHPIAIYACPNPSHPMGRFP